MKDYSNIYDLKKYSKALAIGELYSSELHQQRIIYNDMGVGRPLNYGMGSSVTTKKVNKRLA